MDFVVLVTISSQSIWEGFYESLSISFFFFSFFFSVGPWFGPRIGPKSGWAKRGPWDPTGRVWAPLTSSHGSQRRVIGIDDSFEVNTYWENQGTSSRVRNKEEESGQDPFQLSINKRESTPFLEKRQIVESQPQNFRILISSFWSFGRGIYNLRSHNRIYVYLTRIFHKRKVSKWTFSLQFWGEWNMEEWEKDQPSMSQTRQQLKYPEELKEENSNLKNPKGAH